MLVVCLDEDYRVKNKEDWKDLERKIEKMSIVMDKHKWMDLVSFLCATGQ